MGWYIYQEKNEVAINEAIIDELWELSNDNKIDQIFWNKEDIYYKDQDGKLYLRFNEDDMEHMDYIHDEKILDVLKNHKVNGDICFQSTDGDNAGSAWGYRFDGKGNMTELVGQLNYVEVN